MNVTETKLNGCFILEPRVFKDERGYFFESFNKNNLEKILGSTIDFVQDNESFSSRGVLRGLHYQLREYSQAKLVRVILGKVLDVVVDLRKGSNTFGQHITVELSSDNKKQLFVPRGFAHGFAVLSDTVIFSYKCDNFYNKEAEAGIIYNDSVLNIDWQLPKNEIIVSEKDMYLPTFETARI